jgi:hypothetical protein
MNIFVLDEDATTAAKMMCDKHIVKMFIETCQILSCVLDKNGTEGRSVELELPQYPKAHAKHPCTLWAMESYYNAQWLIDHLQAIDNEYHTRYPRKDHKLKGLANVYRSELEDCSFTEEREMTDFAQAMPDDYKNECPVQAYRTYYLMDKGNFAAWKLETPRWYKYGRKAMLRTIVDKEDSAYETTGLINTA